MSEIGTERIEPTAPVPDRLGNEPRHKPNTRPRRQPVEDTDSGASDNSETPQHQIDSLA